MKPSSEKSKTLRRAAGQVLVAGLEGPRLTPLEAAWLKLIRPAGVILFRRNIESAEQTHALLKEAKDAVRGPLFRFIDVEGGSVDRLRDLIAPMPSASVVAASRQPALFRDHGRLIGREVRMLGLNVTLAPVLDLRTSASESVLGSRTVSGDADEVVEYAQEFLTGLAEEGILGCGKHFPGLGEGKVDSHQSTPTIQKTFASLWREDLLPYRKLTAQLSLVMISHASYPATLSAAVPASVSSFWISGVLRKKLGYQGLILSDDMEMGGILSRVGIGDAAVRALLAGTSLIEICREPALLLTAYEALLAEAETSPAFARRLREAAAEVEAFQDKRLQSDRLPQVPAKAALNKMRGEVQRFSGKVSKLGQAGKGKEPKPA